jgi:hypothetical protein
MRSIFKTAETSSANTRHLQKSDPDTIVDPSNYKNMLFMIASIEEGQSASAQFYSRQSLVDGPALYFDLLEVSPSPTGPTTSPSPTLSPTSMGTFLPTLFPTPEDGNDSQKEDPDVDSEKGTGGAKEAPPDIFDPMENEPFPGDGNTGDGPPDMFNPMENPMEPPPDMFNPMENPPKPPPRFGDPMENEPFPGDGNTGDAPPDMFNPMENPMGPPPDMFNPMENEPFPGDGNTGVGSEGGTGGAMEAPPDMFDPTENEPFPGDGITGVEEPNIFDRDTTTDLSEPAENQSPPGNDDIVIDAPTLAATDAPTDPLVTLDASSDTYLFEGKGGNPNASGRDTRFKVQNFDPVWYPHAYGLLGFEPEWETVPNEVKLCLVHDYDAVEGFDGSGILTTCIVPHMDGIEGLVGRDVDFSVPSSCIGGLVAEFEVFTTTEKVCVDVTSLLLQPDVFPATEETKKVLFILDKVEYAEGVYRFYSSESPSATRPTLEYYDETVIGM